jgi:hypothetical protein
VQPSGRRTAADILRKAKKARREAAAVRFGMPILIGVATAMVQDRESGAKASQYGRDCGKRIMEAIGAKSIKAGSNECSLGSELLSVHCARKHTDRVGMTYKALERIAAELGAFEQEDGSYIIWRLSKNQFEERMIGTKSLRPSKGLVGMVKRIEFERHGVRFATVSPN